MLILNAARRTPRSMNEETGGRALYPAKLLSQSTGKGCEVRAFAWATMLHSGAKPPHICNKFGAIAACHRALERTIRR